MDTNELRDKWNSLNPVPDGGYRSLRLAPDCIPELYIGTDVHNVRCLILRLPSQISNDFRPIVKENLSLEYFKDSQQIILKLTSPAFADLFNDLIISLYNQVRNESSAKRSMEIMLDSFFRWSEFFDPGNPSRLSEQQVIGLIGELYFLQYEIENGESQNINNILNAWQGPFDRGHDFKFENRSVEVKTRYQHSNDIKISSEYQLQSEPGIPLDLVVISVASDSSGISLSSLCHQIRTQITSRVGDFAIFLKAIARKGLTNQTLSDYNHLKYRINAMAGYDCMNPSFPKITTDTKHRLITQVNYSLRITELDEFIKIQYPIDQ